MNSVGVSVAFTAGGFPGMHTATKRTHVTAVAFAATFFISQWLEVVSLVLCGDVRMALGAGDIRMRCRLVNNLFVAFGACVFLRCRG